MSLSVGIVGLPNSGKSTLFNALLKRQVAQVGEYPYTTIEPNVGVVEVPDERLEKISASTGIEKIVPAAVKFVDIAGLIKGASKGEGLGNQFLGHIREVDAILHVVRLFENHNVSHIGGKIDPKEDIEVVDLELELGGIKKPTIYVLNVSENQLNDLPNNLKTLSPYNPVLICAKLEAELSELSEAEQKEYLAELGVDPSTGSGLDKVIKEAYGFLDLITFFTVAHDKQVQAWPLRRGETALSASSLVHADFSKNFIKAEVIGWQELVKASGFQKAKDDGLVRLEGKGYIVADGDVVLFKAGA